MTLLEDSLVDEAARERKAAARRFAVDEIRPVAADYHASGDYPWEVLEAASESGFVAQHIGTAYGGRGDDLSTLLAITEEFFRADAGIALTIQLAGFGCDILEQHGTEEQKDQYLRPVAENDQLSGLAVSEPQTGSDLAGMSTEATKVAGGYELSGEKYWVGNAVEADWLTVYAKTENREDRYSNYSLFVVETDREGYHAEHVPEKIGMRASKQGHIVLEDCFVPETNLIGTEGGGFYMLADFFNKGRVIVGGHGIGLAAAAIEEAEQFVDDREAFGRTINEFQAVQHAIAEMRLRFEAARALVWRACRKVQAGENPGYWAALAKTYGTEAATFCAERSMQLHGGRSIFANRRISRVYRDVRIPVIYEGANEIQRNLIYKHRPR